MSSNGNMKTSTKTSPIPRDLYGLRYADCRPNADHLAEKTCAILAKTWLNRLQDDFRGRESEEWVRNNGEIMEAFERSVTENNPIFSLFESLRYPCDHCGTTIPLRAAHLVSVDANGCLNHDGFPDYLCAACAKDAVGDEE